MDQSDVETLMLEVVSLTREVKIKYFLFLKLRQTVVNKHVVLNLENVLLTVNYFAKIGTAIFTIQCRIFNKVLMRYYCWRKTIWQRGGVLGVIINQKYYVEQGTNNNLGLGSENLRTEKRINMRNSSSFHFLDYKYDQSPQRNRLVTEKKIIEYNILLKSLQSVQVMSVFFFMSRICIYICRKKKGEKQKICTAVSQSVSELEK